MELDFRRFGLCLSLVLTSADLVPGQEFTPLGFLSGHSSSRTFAVSDDGQFVVGRSSSDDIGSNGDTKVEAFVWSSSIATKLWVSLFAGCPCNQTLGVPVRWVSLFAALLFAALGLISAKAVPASCPCRTEFCNDSWAT